MTFFLYSFPLDICIRLWDFFLLEGIFGLVKLLLPILNIFMKDFMKMDSMEVIFNQ